MTQHSPSPPHQGSSRRWTAWLLGGGTLTLLALALSTPDPATEAAGAGDRTAAPVADEAGAPTGERLARLRPSLREPPSGGLSAGPADAAAAPTAVRYADDVVMVRAALRSALSAVAARHGTTVARAPGPSGYGALSVPAGHTPADFLDALQADDQVDSCLPMGIVRGARAPLGRELPGLPLGLRLHSEDQDQDQDQDQDRESRKQKKEDQEGEDQADGDADDRRDAASSAPDDTPTLQWHRARSGLPASTDATDFSRWVVAVLDTGVAYEDHGDDDHEYVRALSLMDVPITAPHDFINNDVHANDDHQHGTHIATIIAGDTRTIDDLDVMGIAPGVTLMPVKVLDDRNQGHELALIDGIYHAVDNGADVINMSLSFGPGYVASPALRAAIDHADRHEVVMVAAAGNDGTEAATWPSASPKVLSIAGGKYRTPNSDGDGLWAEAPIKPAAYTNVGAAVDLTAAGGDLLKDRNNDGHVDGILAETIARGDPSRTELWFYAGSSQAAAVATGAVVHLLEAGVSAAAIPAALQQGANLGEQSDDDGRDTAYHRGAGAGALDIAASLEAWNSLGEDLVPSSSLHAALLPFLRDRGDEVVPKAQVTVVDDAGVPQGGVQVLATIWDGTRSARASCTTQDSGDKLGQCTVSGDRTAPELARAWAFRVDGVEQGGTTQRPTSAIFATDGGEILLRALDDASALDGVALAFAWEAGNDPILGDLAAATTVVNGGTGLSSSPLGLLFLPGALAVPGDEDMLQLDLDGTGLTSSPLGLATVSLRSFSGSGLTSSPLGLNGLQLLTLDSAALAQSALGFHPAHLMAPSTGTGLTSSPLGFDGDPLLLGPQDAVGLPLEGTSFGGWLGGDGMQTAEGYGGASHMLGSGLVDVGWSQSAVEGESSETGSTDLEGRYFPITATADEEDRHR